MIGQVSSSCSYPEAGTWHSSMSENLSAVHTTFRCAWRRKGLPQEPVRFEENYNVANDERR